MSRNGQVEDLNQTVDIAEENFHIRYEDKNQFFVVCSLKILPAMWMFKVLLSNNNGNSLELSRDGKTGYVKNSSIQYADFTVRLLECVLVIIYAHLCEVFVNPILQTQ